MKIAVIGTGYVGLVSAVCFAELGHTVTGIDIDEKKIDKLRSGTCTIYEPGLEEILRRGLKSKHLFFTTDLASVLNEQEVVFSAVATPPKEDFSADLRAVFTVCETVARHAERNLVFVNKSTVPVGTGKECERRIAAVLGERGRSDLSIPVISNPEFLREGSAVRDTMHPDRIVVGINDGDWVRELINELYLPLTRVGKPMLGMSRESAELVKYASNAFLATKISFVNMLSEFCEVTGANIRDVATGMGTDERIGSRFLQAGIGFGGSCFPKDVKALIAMSKESGVPMPIVEATHAVNMRQRERFFAAFMQALPPKATVALWGLSFKPKTDDMREAPSLDLIPALLEAGHTVKVHDPVAMENARDHWLPQGVLYGDSPEEAADGADALMLLTEWDIFRGADFRSLKSLMRGDILFDGRNIYDPDEVREAGFTYVGIGVS